MPSANHAINSTDKEFDMEIQRKEAGAKGARHKSSLLNAHILKPGDDMEVSFICLTAVLNVFIRFKMYV